MACHSLLCHISLQVTSLLFVLKLWLLATISKADEGLILGGILLLLPLPSAFSRGSSVGLIASDIVVRRPDLHPSPQAQAAGARGVLQPAQGVPAHRGARAPRSRISASFRVWARHGQQRFCSAWRCAAAVAVLTACCSFAALNWVRFTSYCEFVNMVVHRRRRQGTSCWTRRTGRTLCRAPSTRCAWCRPTQCSSRTASSGAHRSAPGPSACE